MNNDFKPGDLLAITDKVFITGTIRAPYVLTLDREEKNSHIRHLELGSVGMYIRPLDIKKDIPWATSYPPSKPEKWIIVLFGGTLYAIFEDYTERIEK